MLTHYFTLAALSRELHQHIAGAVIKEVFTQHKNELLLSLEKSGNEFSLSVSIAPQINYVFHRESVSRAKKNSVDLFQHLVEKKVLSIDISGYDRIIVLCVAGNLFLNLLLFNTSASNILLTDDKGLIIEAFKHNNKLEKTYFEKQNDQFDKIVLTSINHFIEVLQQNLDAQIFSLLKVVIPILGSTLSREVLHRIKIPEHRFVKDLTMGDMSKIFDEVNKIFLQLDNPKPTIYYRSDSPKIFSVIQLEYLSGSKIETFQTVNEGVRRFLGYTFQDQALEKEKKSLISKLKSLFERTQKNIDAVQKEILDAEQWKNYERIGNIIVANLQHLTKGTKEIDLPDFYDQNKSVRIKMDPKLTPSQNAEQYFARAKKAKAVNQEAERRIIELKKTANQIETLMLHLDGCHTIDQVDEFKKVNYEKLVQLKIIPKGKSEEPLPFRIFTLEGGFEVWVGKSGASNDLLTMKYAKPNDLWFHVRGTSGSHTILRLGTKQMPSKQIIEKAASISAYYSKMRKAGNVPVSYCERKYVRKPKGSPEGTVIMEREKVIFVEPQLPL